MSKAPTNFIKELDKINKDPLIREIVLLLVRRDELIIDNDGEIANIQLSAEAKALDINQLIFDITENRDNLLKTFVSKNDLLTIINIAFDYIENEAYKEAHDLLLLIENNEWEKVQAIVKKERDFQNS